jgi:hypothetical protein
MPYILSDDPFEISWLMDRRKDRERENSLFAPGNLSHFVMNTIYTALVGFCKIEFFVT